MDRKKFFYEYTEAIESKIMDFWWLSVVCDVCLQPKRMDRF